MFCFKKEKIQTFQIRYGHEHCFLFAILTRIVFFLFCPNVVYFGTLIVILKQKIRIKIFFTKKFLQSTFIYERILSVNFPGHMIFSVRFFFEFELVRIAVAVDLISFDEVYEKKIEDFIFFSL